ncbi:MAG: RNA polymerase sigma factor RpoD/SigA [Bacteroidetes bacterium]|nr:RNA polymerase sigma factor RpoD/SigA [Bacteroidota bacterium]
MRQLRITKQITNRESQSLERYLQEIGKVDLIDAEQEVEFAKRIKKGDQAALKALTQANLRFVVSVAKQYQHQGLSLSDLINEGNLGLIKAANRFDETKGFKFISYAVWWIRQAILQSLAEQARIVRLPLNKIGALNKLGKAFTSLEQEFEREPSADELADLLEITTNEIHELMKGNSRHLSVDAPIQDGEEGTLLDMMMDKNDHAPDQELMKESLKKEIMRILSILPLRDSQILSSYFGLNGEQSLTLEEIGEKFGLTRERVRQIKERAIRRLRKASSSRTLKVYL